MTGKIFRSIAFVGAFVFIMSVVMIMGVVQTHFANVQKQQLREQGKLAAMGISHADEKYFADLDPDGYRLTWISKDGKVKYDSVASTDRMENHIEREEIQQAEKNGIGESSRYSTTLMERQLYVAVKLEDGSFIRLSTTQQTILGLLIGLLNPLIIVIILTLLMSIFLAYRLSRRIVKPLNQMDPEADEEAPYVELEPLVTRLKAQRDKIRKQEAILLQRKEEFETTIMGMTDGVLLVKNDGFIVSVNSAAQRILGMDDYPEGKNLFDYNSSYEIRNMILKAEEGETFETHIPIGDTEYEFHASPIESNGKVSAVSVIILDMTDRKKAELIRREFTANVTHELKTPLQTISGSAELLSKGMVEDKDVEDFGGKIYAESKRMIALIDDIISLSRLEEGVAELEREEVDLYGMAEKTVSSLMPAAEQQNVTLSVKGVSQMITGVPQLIGSLIFNLVDNAIKYGRDGGTVDVEVSGKEGKAVLTVTDDGIGIPEDEKERVFERFYRVDKSRSKAAGGTGLGLSIVKHAAMVHNADVELSSTLGKGTKVTVTFPEEEKR